MILYENNTVSKNFSSGHSDTNEGKAAPELVDHSARVLLQAGVAALRQKTGWNIIS